MTRIGYVLLCTCLCLFLGACEMLKNGGPALVPLSLAGAEYVGAETCSTSDCHQAEHRYFRFNRHASVAISISEDEAEEGQVEACETCHGPGSLHVENRGRKQGDILVGPGILCFNCHLDIKGRFMLQHHHPVPEALMACTDCHSAHGRDVRSSGGMGFVNRDEACFACHKEMRGPFVFEHDAMREGCTSCHTPHGSINAKLLVAGHSTTCLRCHWESAFNSATGDIGSHAHSSHPIGAGQDCVDCHVAIHGSNIWRSLRK